MKIVVRNPQGRRLLAAALAAAWPFAAAGCGSSSSQTTATVTPEAQKKTEDMLKNMQNQMYAKYGKKPPTSKKR